nr:putative reverse transcriptase domain-containing protein [Tanacetum cinerariifolium]
EVGDRVLLKVSPWKGVIRFGTKGKLALRYVGPFEILERIDPVAYRLRLPEELSSVHDTFHVSNLKKCLADANPYVPLDEIKINKTLRFVEEPVEIMNRKVRSLKRSKISLVKVCWNSKCGPKFTWEQEDHMKSKYPQLFVDRAIEPEDEISLRRGYCDTRNLSKLVILFELAKCLYINKTLRFVEEPVEIMNRKVRSLKRSKISLVKVCWNSKCGPKFTWEQEDHMKSKYPQLFVDRAIEPEDEISLRRGYCDTRNLSKLVILFELAKCLYVLYL